MDEKTLEDDGSAGHWGLHGMRERAKLIGGNIEVWSRLNSGTEIELSVPASIAYRPSVSGRKPWFFRKGNSISS